MTYNECRRIDLSHRHCGRYGFLIGLRHIAGQDSNNTEKFNTIKNCYKSLLLKLSKTMSGSFQMKDLSYMSVQWRGEILKHDNSEQLKSNAA